MIGDFIPYKEALALKELGFDEPCMSSRDMNNGEGLIQLSLYQQALRWFREKHKLYVDLFVDDDETFGFMISYFTEDARVDKPIKRGFSTYREAELASIDMLIETVKSSAHGK